MRAWWRRFNSAEFTSLSVEQRIRTSAWLIVPGLVAEAIVFGLIRDNWGKQSGVFAVALVYAIVAIFAPQIVTYWANRHEPRKRR